LSFNHLFVFFILLVTRTSFLHLRFLFWELRRDLVHIVLALLFFVSTVYLLVIVE
jgi:hypothetical protein